MRGTDNEGDMGTKDLDGPTHQRLLQKLPLKPTQCRRLLNLIATENDGSVVEARMRGNEETLGKFSTSDDCDSNRIGDVGLLSGGDVRVCTAYSETDNEVENIVMDALETTKSLHLARSSVLHESMRSSVVVAQAAAHRPDSAICADDVTHWPYNLVFCLNGLLFWGVSTGLLVV